MHRRYFAVVVGFLALHLSITAAPAAVEYQSLLSAERAALQATQQLLQAQPDSWLWYGRLATQCRHLALLTGDLAYRRQAAEALEAAFALAPPGSGPLLERARSQAGMHQYAAAKADLAQLQQRLLLPSPLRRTIKLELAALARAEGEFAAAEAAYRQVLSDAPTPTGYFHLADLLRHTGRVAEAETCLQQALQQCRPQEVHLRSWLHLQRGLLAWELGAAAIADEHYQNAEALLPGWWLVEEHRAEARAELGHRQESIELYEDLIRRTADPAFMAAVADLYADSGQTEAAAAWRQRATLSYRELLAEFPEAIGGHALDHFTHPALPELHAEALSLAQAQFAQAPAGDAALALVRALRLNGELQAALQHLRRVEASPWRSASYFEEAELLHRALGDAAQASAVSGQLQALQAQYAATRSKPHS